MQGTSEQAHKMVGEDTQPVAEKRDGPLTGAGAPFLPRLVELRARRALRHRLSGFAVVLDLAAIGTAYVVVSLAYLSFVDLEQLGRVLLSLAPIFFAFNLNSYAYSAEILLDKFRSAWRGSSGLILATLLLFLSFFFLKISAEFSRVLLGIGTLSSVVLLSLSRAVIASYAQRAIGPSPIANLHIYDGVAPIAQHLEVAVLADQIGLAPNPEDPSMLALMGQIALGIDGVVVHCPASQRAQWAFMLKSLDVSAEIVTPELSDLRPLGINYRAGETSLVLGSGQLSWSQGIVKRCFDLVATGAAIPLIAPLLVVIAIVIKLESRGPVLFRQERIGLGNRKFKIMKFRTMYLELQDEEAKKSTSREDPRVTRVGQFLRRTSLDELPQFLNVLLGNMSIVGPRPHAERTAVGSSLLWEIDAAYWHRHVVKPGITGLAQVRGHRGSLFEEEHLRERLNADLEYVSNWSLAKDIKIILRTLGVLIHKNAF